MEKKLVRLYAALVALALLLVSVTGCSGNGGQSSVSREAAAQATEAASQSETEQPAESSGREEAGETREITDMAGRVVTVPATINKVYGTDPVSAIFLYTLSPGHLLGWNYELNDLERKYIQPAYQTLDVFGMGDSVNYEAIIAAGPDIAVLVGSGDEANQAEAEKLSDSIGVPVVIVGNKLEETAAVYRFLGDLLGVMEQAEKLAAYADKTFEDVTGMEIPEAERVRIYYGSGEDSLETAPKGSIHAQIIDMVGAENVAEVEVEGSGRVSVSLEQVMAWNPDVIIVNGEAKNDLTGNDAAQAILANPDFAQVKAAQDGNVFGAPKAPFSWIDRPRSANRIIGVRWLAKKIYPERFDYEVDAEVKEFYELFYHIELTVDQLKELYEE